MYCKEGRSLERIIGTNLAVLGRNYADARGGIYWGENRDE